MKIPDFLVQSARDKRLVPFVGSGVSLAVKPGLFPTWRQLLERLADQLEAQGKQKQAQMVRGHCELDELYEAAQRAARHLGPPLFHDAMRDTFRIGRPEDVDLSLPQALWALRPRLAVTTNFDSVLQWACPAATAVLNNQPPDLADLFARPTEAAPWVWHLHGHIDHADTLILAPEQYDKFYQQAAAPDHPWAAAHERLRHLASTCPLLFVGFGLQDRFVMDLLQRVLTTFGRNLRPSFALLKKDEADARQIWKQHNIQVIEFDEYGEPLVAAVRQIVAAVQSAPVATGKSGGAAVTSPPLDPACYLRDLCAKTEFIDIRGLQVGKGQANRLSIEELFISLTTTQVPEGAEADAGRKAGKRGEAKPTSVKEHALPAESRTVPLHQALRHDRLVVVGDPGSGKTTFLRRVAHTLCQTQSGDEPEAAQTRLGVADRTFPVFIRVSDLAQHLTRHTNQGAAPEGDDAPDWLPHYLASAGRSNGWNLDAAYFRQLLATGQCTVLLDGLDEAPDRAIRERISRLIENATRSYARCRFVVTSRPAAYTGEVVLPGFAHARIDPLADEAVETFLKRWCQAVYVESQKAADEHCSELLSAVRAKTEIRRMARNPVMLTALAVVHWNERRLPEQRADLYNSIILWLSRARQQRSGRATADRTIVLLQELALAMQDPASQEPEASANGPSAPRLTQVPKRWAAEHIAPEFAAGDPITRETIQSAERFLEEEEVDSGIIVARGNELTFWHLTFQEFLAARAIASRLETEQQQLLFGDPGKLYRPDWREVVTLLSGTLHQQGRAKVDGLIGRLLDGLGTSPTLAERARCAGLVGLILRDLEPLNYQVSDARYPELLEAVTAIFDPARSESVQLEERIAAADALGQAGDVRLDPRRDDYWVTIPAGKFRMGAQKSNRKKPNFDEEAYDDESPVHEVYLDAYRIARYPVTVGLYQRFVEEEGYEEERWWQSGGFGEFSEPGSWEEQAQFPSRPVVGVSWYEAAAFAAWAGFRLPTEAEWERAARGTTGRKYPWGDEGADEKRLNFAPEWKPNVGHPTPVGIYPLGMTHEGICDLGGDVCEWCQDWYGEYPAEAVSKPQGSSEAGLRVIRGGGWGYFARSCRAASRLRYEPQVRIDSLGLRLAAVPQAKFSPFPSPVSSPSPAEPGAEAEAAQGR